VLTRVTQPTPDRRALIEAALIVARERLRLAKLAFREQSARTLDERDPRRAFWRS
jgi:hypothetical protein